MRCKRCVCCRAKPAAGFELWCQISVSARALVRRLGGVPALTEFSGDISGAAAEALEEQLIVVDSDFRIRLSERGQALLDWWETHERYRREGVMGGLSDV